MIDKSRPADRHCSECGKPSHLRLVIPSNDKPAYDERFFECRSCGYSETLYVRIARYAASDVAAV